MGITVFTNGMMPSEKLADAVKHFAQLPDEMLSFVCNINHPDITPKGEMEMALNFLKAFGRRITQDLISTGRRLILISSLIISTNMACKEGFGWALPIPYQA